MYVTEGFRVDPETRRYVTKTIFDNFEVIAEPLATRESRVLGRVDGRNGCDYGSHSIKLAVSKDFPGGCPRRLFILMQHGGGREVLAIKTMYDRGAFEAALLAMPEAVQYAALYTIWDTAARSVIGAREAVRAEWAQAYVDKRIRKSRPKQGRQCVTIEPKVES